MPTANKLPLKRQRAEYVNQTIRIIGTQGRRFFFNQVADRYATGGEVSAAATGAALIAADEALTKYAHQ